MERAAADSHAEALQLQDMALRITTDSSSRAMAWASSVRHVLKGVPGTKAVHDTVLRLHLTCAALPPVIESEPSVRYGEGCDLWDDGRTFTLRTPVSHLRVVAAEGIAEGCIAESVDPGNPLELPTSTALLAVHMMLREHGFMPLHGAGVGYRGQGVIVTGSSGSGKSTLAYRLVRSGWRFLTDDSLLLRVERAGPRGDRVVMRAGRGRFGFTAETLDLHPELHDAAEPQRTDPSKASIDLADVYPGQRAAVLAPCLVVAPQIVDAPTSRFERLSATEAFFVLAEQSALLRLRRAWTEAHHDLLRRLVQQAPTFQLFAGHDLLDDPEEAARLITPLLPSL